MFPDRQLHERHASPGHLVDDVDAHEALRGKRPAGDAATLAIVGLAAGRAGPSDLDGSRRSGRGHELGAPKTEDVRFALHAAAAHVEVYLSAHQSGLGEGHATGRVGDELDLVHGAQRHTWRHRPCLVDDADLEVRVGLRAGRGRHEQRSQSGQDDPARDGIHRRQG